MKSAPKKSKAKIKSKPNLRANGLSLLPLALRPGLAASLLLAAVLIPAKVSASSMTLTIPEAISLPVSPTAEGAFAKSSEAIISAKTDSTKGYTLSIKSKETTDSNCLKNGTSKIESIDSAMSEADYKSTGKVNTWAYQPTKFNSLANTNFLPTPTSSESVIDKTLLGNAEAANTYGIILAAKVNTSVPTGKYANQEIITMASNALSYSVTFNLNEGTGGPTSPQTGTTEGNTFTLASEIPTKEDNEFKGWCTVQPTEDGECDGGVYQPGATFTINCDTNDLQLYAMWEENNTRMQNWKGCNKLSEHETITLTDTRDSNTYTVAKLKDGKCWMTQNLRLSNRTLTSLDSDVNDSFTLPQSDISGFATSAKNGNSDGQDHNFCYVDGMYGGYYTWYAATAGEGTRDRAASSGYEVAQSICPKGWKLPNKSEGDTLASRYDYSTIRQYPANFELSGYLLTSNLSSNNNIGAYFTSTGSGNVCRGCDNSAYPYDLYLTKSSFTVSTPTPHGSGLSVRCISR